MNKNILQIYIANQWICPENYYKAVKINLVILNSPGDYHKVVKNKLGYSHRPRNLYKTVKNNLLFPHNLGNYHNHKSTSEYGQELIIIIDQPE